MGFKHGSGWVVITFTFRSFKQLELSVTNKVRKAHPIFPIAGLGVSVIGSAGFG